MRPWGGHRILVNQTVTQGCKTCDASALSEPFTEPFPCLTKSTRTFNSSNRSITPCVCGIPTGSSPMAIAPPATSMSYASRTCLAFLPGRTVLYRASQLRKRFAKLRGRATDDSPKRAIEVRHGLKSACESSFANSRVGIEQKRL
jgi:hypothetical protein